MRESVLNDVRNAHVWTFLADETQDRAKREQLAGVVRYVSGPPGEQVIKEDPVLLYDVIEDVRRFLPADTPEVKLSGDNIGGSLLRNMKQTIQLPLSTLVGLGFDGAANVASVNVGAGVTIRREAPLAETFYCCMHGVNLGASQSTKVKDISHCEDVIRDLFNHFKHVKHQEHLTHVITTAEDGQDKPTKSRLIKLCPTRFIERHESVLVARELLPYVVEALLIVQDTWQGKAASAACNMLRTVRNQQFIYALLMLEKVSAAMKPVVLTIIRDYCQ